MIILLGFIGLICLAILFKVLMIMEILDDFHYHLFENPINYDPTLDDKDEK